MTSNKRWLIGVGGLIAVMAVAASMQQPNTTKPRGAAALKPVNVAAEDIAQAFEDNEVAATSRYAGELLRARGTIDTIGIDGNGVPYVEFGSYRRTAVRANFTKGANELRQLSKGQDVAVVCVGVGKGTLVFHMKDCRLD